MNDRLQVEPVPETSSKAGRLKDSFRKVVARISNLLRRSPPVVLIALIVLLLLFCYTTIQIFFSLSKSTQKLESSAGTVVTGQVNPTVAPGRVKAKYREIDIVAVNRDGKELKIQIEGEKDKNNPESTSLLPASFTNSMHIVPIQVIGNKMWFGSESIVAYIEIPRIIPENELVVTEKIVYRLSDSNSTEKITNFRVSPDGLFLSVVTDTTPDNESWGDKLLVVRIGAEEVYQVPLVEERTIYARLTPVYVDGNRVVVKRMGGDGCGSGGSLWKYEYKLGTREKITDLGSGCSMGKDRPDYITTRESTNEVYLLTTNLENMGEMYGTDESYGSLGLVKINFLTKAKAELGGLQGKTIGIVGSTENNIIFADYGSVSYRYYDLQKQELSPAINFPHETVVFGDHFVITVERVSDKPKFRRVNLTTIEEVLIDNTEWLGEGVASVTMEENALFALIKEIE